LLNNRINQITEKEEKKYSIYDKDFKIKKYNNKYGGKIEIIRKNKK